MHGPVDVGMYGPVDGPTTMVRRARPWLEPNRRLSIHPPVLRSDQEP